MGSFCFVFVCGKTLIDYVIDPFVELSIVIVIFLHLFGPDCGFEISQFLK